MSTLALLCYQGPSDKPGSHTDVYYAPFLFTVWKWEFSSSTSTSALWLPLSSPCSLPSCFGLQFKDGPADFPLHFTEQK